MDGNGTTFVNIFNMEYYPTFNSLIDQFVSLFYVAFPFYHLISEVSKIFIFAGCTCGPSLSCNLLAGVKSGH